MVRGPVKRLNAVELLTIHRAAVSCMSAPLPSVQAPMPQFEAARILNTVFVPKMRSAELSMPALAFTRPFVVQLICPVKRLMICRDGDQLPPNAPEIIRSPSLRRVLGPRPCDDSEESAP